MSKKKMDPIIKHQIEIAKRTLKMTDAILGVMGGPTKEEAKETLRKFGVKF
jgi:hypothetical protein